MLAQRGDRASAGGGYRSAPLLPWAVAATERARAFASSSTTPSSPPRPATRSPARVLSRRSERAPAARRLPHPEPRRGGGAARRAARGDARPTWSGRGGRSSPSAPRAVLMKGGHLDGDEAVDLLVTADGVRRFAAPKIASREHARHRLHAVERHRRACRSRACARRRRRRRPRLSCARRSSAARGEARRRVGSSAPVAAHYAGARAGSRPLRSAGLGYAALKQDGPTASIFSAAATLLL